MFSLYSSPRVCSSFSRRLPVSLKSFRDFPFSFAPPRPAPSDTQFFLRGLSLLVRSLPSHLRLSFSSSLLFSLDFSSFQLFSWRRREFRRLAPVALLTALPVVGYFIPAIFIKLCPHYLPLSLLSPRLLFIEFSSRISLASQSATGRQAVKEKLKFLGLDEFLDPITSTRRLSHRLASFESFLCEESRCLNFPLERLATARLLLACAERGFYKPLISKEGRKAMEERGAQDWLMPMEDFSDSCSESEKFLRFSLIEALQGSFDQAKQTKTTGE